MEKAVFKRYENGYYTFGIENGEDLVFEEINPRVLQHYDLKTDKTLIGETFEISYTERYEDDEDDLLVYRIEALKCL